jgi:hypothetical protein
MAVIKESSISSRVVESIVNVYNNVGKISSGSLFSASEIMGCHRRAVLDKKLVGSTESPQNIHFRYAMHRSSLFDIVKEDFSVSSMEVGVECKIDMLAKYADEYVIILIGNSEPNAELPLKGDVVNMVAAMYASGVWSGLIAYQIDGSYRVFFANPDRADAKRILVKMAERSDLLQSYVMNETIPHGETCNGCNLCPHAGSCDVLSNGAVEQDGEVGKREEGMRGDRQEEGERISS